MSGLYTDTELLEELGKRIKEYRKQKKVSQTELADFCGVNRRTIMLLEQGKGISLLYFVRVLRMFDLESSLLDLIPEETDIDPFDM